MAQTPSTMLPLGTPAPDFAVTEVSGATVRHDDAAGKPLLVVFMCNHCPFVKHVRATLASIGRDYQAKGVAVVGINSNDAERYPADSFAQMAVEKRDAGYTFAYGFDASQAAAKAYRAACTPDTFLFDAAHRLVYRGQIDDSRPGQGESTGRDLRAALDAVLAGKAVPEPQKPSIGCNIKWKTGSEPAWFAAKR